MQEWYLWLEKVSCLERCPQFRSVLIERERFQLCCVSFCYCCADVVANGQPIPMDSDFSMDLSVGVPVNVQLTLTNNSS